MGSFPSTFLKPKENTSFHYDQPLFDTLIQSTELGSSSIPEDPTTNMSSPPSSSANEHGINTRNTAPGAKAKMDKRKDAKSTSQRDSTATSERVRVGFTEDDLSPTYTPLYSAEEPSTDHAINEPPSHVLKRKRNTDDDDELEPFSKHARAHSPVPSSMPSEQDSAGGTMKSSDKNSKRKREADDEHGSLAKVGRHYSPDPSSPTDSNEPPMSISAQHLKRKRSVSDNQHGALGKAPRTYSPVSSSDIENEEHGRAGSSSQPLERKRKRAADDNEHGTLSKTARTCSPVESPWWACDSDSDDLPNVLLERKRKRSMEDNEHGSLSKAPRTYSPVDSPWWAPDSDSDDNPNTIQVRKRKRSLEDDEHGAQSKAARTYSPINTPWWINSDNDESPKTLKHKRSEVLDHDDRSSSPSKRRRRSPEPESRKHRLEEDSDHEGGRLSHSKRSRYSADPQRSAAAQRSPPRQESPPPADAGKPKRKLPWHEKDYPYYTKKPRIEIPEDPNYPPQPTHEYDGLRYFHTAVGSDVKWDPDFGVLLGELTHLKVPRVPPPHGWGCNVRGEQSRHINHFRREPLWALPAKPPPVHPKQQLKKRDQLRKDKLKAKKLAQKQLKAPPQVTHKKEVKERFLVYARFNRHMRFSLRVIPQTTVKTTEFRTTNAPPGQAKGNGQGNMQGTKPGPPIMTTSNTKVFHGKQSKLALEQFDMYLSLGRMVWAEEWKEVFQKGEREGMKDRDGDAMDVDGQEPEQDDGLARVAREREMQDREKEDCGEGVRDMGGLRAVMRKVMASPPPHETIMRRIRCFEATGKFEGIARGI